MSSLWYKQRVCSDKLINSTLFFSALSRIEADLGNFRNDDFISSAQAKLVKNAVLKLCQEVKKNAIAFVDAVAPPDAILCSPIGKSDGEVYKNLYNAIITAPGAFESKKNPNTQIHFTHPHFFLPQSQAGGCTSKQILPFVIVLRSRGGEGKVGMTERHSQKLQNTANPS